ncbi:hypothetical protein Ddc_19538 [Ditylenchus destructor]|nr:hypothetical protein Ddc_19538 [Ditylenchus destructor]
MFVLLKLYIYFSSLPSDVWSEILRYFSRKQLCQQIHLVNHQLYNFANSRHNVPTTHVIYRTSFHTVKRPHTFLNVFKSRQFNCVRFGDYGSKELETHQLRKMPIPKPFIRFRKVLIWRLLEKSTLKFLCDAKESFIGSAIHYSMDDILDNKNMRNQMHYLLQNVFQKPSYISVTGPCLRLSNLKVLTDGLLNCSRMKLDIWCGFKGALSDEDTIRMSLDWLNSGKSLVQSSQRDTVEKHLVLGYLHRKSILDMVQQIKDAFIGNTLLFSDFVITFSSSNGNRLCLEGDHTFTLNKMSSNERLSFLTHNQHARNVSGFGRAYRLWCRRVVNEPEDLKMATHLQNLNDGFDLGIEQHSEHFREKKNLEHWSRLGIDLHDQQFYDFDYPIAWSP